MRYNIQTDDNQHDQLSQNNQRQNRAGDTQKSTRPLCPYCGSTDTELFSLFGQHLLTVTLYCNACHTPFEHVKDDDVLDDFATRATQATRQATRKEDQP
jgi:uncharacterized protein (DUF983 family)